MYGYGRSEHRFLITVDLSVLRYLWGLLQGRPTDRTSKNPDRAHPPSSPVDRSQAVNNSIFKVL